MDGREGMALQGSASYYLNRGGIGASGGSGHGPNVHGSGGASAAAAQGGIHSTSVFKTFSNPNMQANVGVSGGGAVSGSSFHVQNPSPNFPHGMSMGGLSIASQGSSGEPVKKKRGRPRKYGPDGANMSLGLSPMPESKPSPIVASPGDKGRRGRPPGTGWKQKLAPLGEWMTSSAGLAFTPHVLHVRLGEDVAAKILAFAQQRPRALCILSANGSVSGVTLRQPATSGGDITYEGRFEILCLSGSYLVSESGGPRNRIGGISISVCTPDGHIVGGAVGGRLIAASPVQVVACSFVYGNTKVKNASESGMKDERYPGEHSGDNKSLATATYMPNSGTSFWPPVSRPEVKNSQMDIDLMRG